MSDILEVKNLKKYFKTPSGWLHAVENVSFSLEEGKTLGIVGESGCGKSTLGRVIIGLLDATDGSVRFDGKEVVSADEEEWFNMRKEMQIIFQDPFSSLNPRLCVREIIAEPLEIYNLFKSRDELDARVYEIMKKVGLAERLAYSYPHELDGGRRQRIGIGRALALNPRFIVCDEPVSALDVSIQAQILNLMQDLQEEGNLTYIFISHNLATVKHISNDILVMYLGCMVEKCAAQELFEYPLHPYTKGLLSAIPIPTINRKRQQFLLTGELSSPINPKPGCRFASRCSYTKDKCLVEAPEMEEIKGGHFVACHFARDINAI